MQIRDGKNVTLSLEELRTLILSSPQDRNDQKHEASWLNGKELCKLFPVLSYGKVKDRKWRDENDFPYFQEDLYCKVRFNTSDVKQWIDAQKNKSPYSRI